MPSTKKKAKKQADPNKDWSEHTARLPIPGPGRPSSFKEEYIEQAHKLSLLGITEEQMAEFFKVDYVTFIKWKKDNPAFLKAIDSGKVIADANVATSTYKKAIGEVIQVDKVIKDKDGNQKVVTLNVQQPSDTNAQRMWLFNRQRHLWRNTQHVEQSGSVDVVHQIEHVIVDPEPRTIDYRSPQKKIERSEGEDI